MGVVDAECQECKIAIKWLPGTQMVCRACFWRKSITGWGRVKLGPLHAIRHNVFNEGVCGIKPNGWDMLWVGPIIDQKLCKICVDIVGDVWKDQIAQPAS